MWRSTHNDSDFAVGSNERGGCKSDSEDAVDVEEHICGGWKSDWMCLVKVSLKNV